MVGNDWENGLNGLNGPNSSKSLPNCPKMFQNAHFRVQTPRCPNGLVIQWANYGRKLTEMTRITV